MTEDSPLTVAGAAADRSKWPYRVPFDPLAGNRPAAMLRGSGRSGQFAFRDVRSATRMRSTTIWVEAGLTMYPEMPSSLSL